MKRAEDVGVIKEKPYNSILPYLRAKKAEEKKAETTHREAEKWQAEKQSL